MEKKNRMTLIITVIVCLLPMILGAVLYNKLPEQMPIHFNIKNEPDNYASKSFALFGLPIIMAIVQAVCIVVTSKASKLKYNEKRENEVDYLTIDNNYAFNKNYKIYLETTKNIDLSTKIIINNRSYILNDFYQSEEENTIKFTLIDKNVVASTDAYNIIVKADEYNYIFEEINNF